MADSVADGGKETVDVINLLLLGWILLGLVVYILGNVIATQIRKRKAKNYVSERSEATAGTSPKPTADEVPSPADDVVEESAENLPFEIPVIAPVCTGEEPDVTEWINNVFSWIYGQRVLSPVLDSWLNVLNARTRLLSIEHGVLVDFKNVVHSHQAPNFNDVVESLGPKGTVTVSCEAEVLHLVFEVLVTQIKDKDKNVYKFMLKLNRLAGRLKIVCIPEQSAFFAQFSERPQIELEVNPESLTDIPPGESEALHNLICEIATESFSSSTVEMRFSSYPECPKFVSTELSSNGESFNSAEEEKEEKLLVKVVRASNIGNYQNVSKPYCIIEMDEPPQRFETDIAEDGSNPFWDATFVFICKSASSELLFELYDKDKPSNENFLGLCIVSIEELMRNPSQRQTTPLQPRPLENDQISGTITSEFLFLDRSISPTDGRRLPTVSSQVDIQPGKTVETNSRVTAGGTLITTTTIKRTTEGVDDLTDTALKELEKRGKPIAPNKSTLIIHSVQREVVQPSMKVKLDKCGKWQEIGEADVSGNDSLEASPASHPSGASQDSHQSSLPPSPLFQRNGVDRSRPKLKKSFIGNIRKKLSFRKGRSKSMELRSDPNLAPGEGDSRSVSNERGKRALTVHETSSGNRFLGVPGSSRSSFSEASGLSTASSKTYINENSTLVIEINENGIIKRYLIPTSMIHRSKWKKKGVKLHLYNDHVFVAKHLSGFTACQVCKKYLTRRPGKQGYECRDCNLQCHKSCHVKVADYCPNSSVTSMEVEYIHDPKTTKLQPDMNPM